MRVHRALQNYGWELTVLLPKEQGNAAARLRGAGVPVVEIPLHRLRASLNPRLALLTAITFPREVARIKRIIKNGNFDLVVLSGLINPHAALAGRMAGAAVLWMLIDSRTPTRLRAPMMSIVRRTGDAAMFTGFALADWHAGKNGVGLPHFIFYPPVDTSAFVPSAERRCATRHKLGIPDGALVVGTVANLNPQKGLEDFIRAAALIQRSVPDAWFLVVGATLPAHRGYAAALRRQLESSAVSQFLFVDAQPDVENYYAAMDVKVISSVRLSEGVPTTALEAQSCAVPVVTTRVGAVAEAVVHGATGFVVEPEDHRALAEAILQLLRQPELRRRFAAEARKQAVDRYDVAVCAASQAHAFNETLGLARRREGGKRRSVI
jgi:glycosyltransferase involved in cell wall biosynthesis